MRKVHISDNKYPIVEDLTLLNNMFLQGRFEDKQVSQQAELCKVPSTYVIDRFAKRANTAIKKLEADGAATPITPERLFEMSITEKKVGKRKPKSTEKSKENFEQDVTFSPKRKKVADDTTKLTDDINSLTTSKKPVAPKSKKTSQPKKQQCQT
ncbi:ANKRD17 [Mytilus edulis]|uniref:ANKRD17 n=1 Tax=Mytilus edulis TaxID=6550 RepID=A0A8S3S628_MYTED|nr:ANKRD17 [Mytilus edulis]